MAKKEITYKELPRKIKIIMNKLITARWDYGYADPICNIYGKYVTPDKLQMFVKKIYCEKLEDRERYDFEVAPSAAEEAGGTVSAVYLPSKKADNLIRFTLYGEDRDCSLSMGAKLFYEEEDCCWESDDEYERHLHLCLAGQPDYVTLKDGKRTLFRWTPEEFSSDSLIETLQIPNSTPLAILNQYTKLEPRVVALIETQDKVKEEYGNMRFPDRELVSELRDRLVEQQRPSREKAEHGEGRNSHEIYGGLWEYAEAINDEHFTVERDVLFQIMRELAPWLHERERAEERLKMETAEETGTEETDAEEGAAKRAVTNKVNLPNLVFFGEPGTGKSELAKRIAKKILKAKFSKVTGGALKAPYEGQTSGEIIKRFSTLQREAGNENVPVVLFIDEAYDLFNNRTDAASFNGEIITMLLTAMEPGKRTLSATAVSGTSSCQLSVTLNENTAVWMAGYEKDMRKALSSNSGMYRRVESIALPTPAQSSLWNTFLQTLKAGHSDEATQEGNRKLCEECEGMINEYFHWGRSKTYAEFFANYAGAIKLGQEIEKSSLLNRRPLTAGELTALIEQQKKEIRAQYKHVVEENFGRLPFMVYTDVGETIDKDYIGAEGATEKLKQVIEMICDPKAYSGCSIPKGALMKGSPGTGKSFLARCMAGSVMKAIKETQGNRKDVAFIKVAGTDLNSAELVKALFSAAEEYDQVIIFIDEIDAIGKRRERLSNDGALIQLLNEMDGFEKRCNVFVLAATNAPETLDAALRRAGRFDMEIEIENPEDDSRREMVRRNLRLHLPHLSGFDKLFQELVGELSRQLRGCSPAQIQTLLNEAAILYHDCERKLSKKQETEWKPWFAQREFRGDSIPEGVQIVRLKEDLNVMVLDDSQDADKKAGGCKTLFLLDFKEVLAKRSIGERRKPGEFSEDFSSGRNDGSLSSTAIHEVGHALVSVLYGRSFEKITILTRGGALGYVEPNSEQKMFTKQDYLEQLDICFGGRAAEELIYGADQISGGAQQDIQQASRLARFMILQLGMSDKVGPVSLEADMGGYLGGETVMLTTQSAMTMAEDEVRKLLKERYSASVEMLRAHRDTLLKLARHVFEREELTGAEFESFYRDSFK